MPAIAAGFYTGQPGAGEMWLITGDTRRMIPEPHKIHVVDFVKKVSGPDAVQLITNQTQFDAILQQFTPRS